MGADWDGNVWVGFHETGKLVKFDQKTAQMTIYQPPTEKTARITWSPIQSTRCFG